MDGFAKHLYQDTLLWPLWLLLASSNSTQKASQDDGTYAQLNNWTSNKVDQVNNIWTMQCKVGQSSTYISNCKCREMYLCTWCLFSLIFVFSWPVTIHNYVRVGRNHRRMNCRPFFKVETTASRCRQSCNRNIHGSIFFTLATSKIENIESILAVSFLQFFLPKV